MTAEASIRVVDRIIQVLDHLGVRRAHNAGGLQGDWQALVSTFADRVASLSLVCPATLPAGVVKSMAARLLIVHGDRGAVVDRVRAAVTQIPEATVVTLPDYAGLPFSDVALERRD